MEARRLPVAKIVAGVLLALVGGFDLVTYSYHVANGTSLPTLAVFDGTISAGAALLAFGLWKAATLGRAVKLTFVTAAVFFVLWVFVIPFATPFTELIAYPLLLAALITLVTGIFMRKGS